MGCCETAQDIYAVVMPLYYLSKLLGLAPLTLAVEGGARRFVPSVASMLYVLVILLLKTACQAFAIWKTVYVDRLQAVFGTAAVIECIAYTATTLMVHTLSLTNREKVAGLVASIAAFDRLSRPVVRWDYVRLHRFVMSQIATSLSCFFLLCFVIDVNARLPTYLHTLSHYSLYLCIMSILVVDLQVVNVVMVLKQRFAAVNVNLQDLRPEKSIAVQYLKELHDILCDICETTNTTYSLNLLMTITVKFVVVVFYIYFCTLRVLQHDVGEYEDAVWVGFTFSWACWYTFALTATVWVCDSAAQEANRTAVLVHKLLNKTRDPEIKEELQLFSLQLLHRKVQFTACGFFPLDFTLLYSIVGAVTTYLVILIQFQLSFVQQHQQQNTTSITTPVSENLSVLFNRDSPLPLVG